MIEIQHISKTFNKGKEDEVKALTDISITINKGEFVIIIGSNGSGKSTFFNIIQGTEHPTLGKVFINNNDITNLEEYKRSKLVSRIFQNPGHGTAPDLSIGENFRLAALRTKSKTLQIGNNKEFKKLIKDKIASLGMGLENKIDQPMGSLSGGQRQALTLLMSVMDDTNVLLMDEPTAALDPKSAQIILQIADKMNKEMGLTILLVTHSLRDAHQYGNRLLQFKEGAIVRDIKSSEKSNLTLPDLYNWF